MNDLETRLAGMLHERAAAASPDDRLGDVLAGSAQPVRRAWWPAVVAAAAAVLLVVGGVWLTKRDRPTDRVRPATVVPGVWGELPAPPLGPREGSVSVATDDGWFVWGGQTESNGEVADESVIDGAYYERATGEWRTVPDAPFDASGRGHFVTAVWTGTEVVMASDEGSPQFAAFDPQAFTWRSIAVPADVVAMWPEREGGYDAPAPPLFWVAGRVVALLPGFVDDRAYSRLLTLDPATGAFVASLQLPPPMRIATPVVASDDSLYFVDSSIGDCRGTRHVLVYDAAGAMWREVDLPHDDWVPSIVAWTGAGLMVAGGTECTQDQAGVRFAALLDPGTNRWRARAEPPQDHRNVMFAPTAAADGLVASLDYDGAPFVYDSGLDRWWVGPPILPGDNEQAVVSAARLVAWGRDLVIWSPQLGDSTTTGTVLHLAVPDPSIWPDPPVTTVSL